MNKKHKFRQTSLIEYGFPKVQTTLKLFKHGGKKPEKIKILPPSVGYRWFFDVKPRTFIKKRDELRKEVDYVMSLVRKSDKPKKHGRRSVRLWFPSLRDAKRALRIIGKAGKLVKIWEVDEFGEVRSIGVD